MKVDPLVLLLPRVVDPIEAKGGGDRVPEGSMEGGETNPIGIPIDCMTDRVM